VIGDVVDRPERLRDDPDVSDRLRGLASQATIAIRNARLLESIRHQALHDSLTGLPNRTLILDRVEQMLARARRLDTESAALFIDLDGFKQVNDLKGHAAGDELLVELGRAWARELRGSEVLARLGGDEFALLFVADGDAAVDALGRLREAAPVGWSAGVVEWRPGESLERAMARADEDLYRAKREARDEIAPLAIIGEWPPA
jgi:diguanylate cyclase (GGDEF)-like protein